MTFFKDFELTLLIIASNHETSQTVKAILRKRKMGNITLGFFYIIKVKESKLE